MDEPQDDIEQIGAAIAANGPTHTEIQGSVLTGWTLVAEWMAPDGTRWLSRLRSPYITAWAEKGMHHEVINGALTDNDNTE